MRKQTFFGWKPNRYIKQTSCYGQRQDLCRVKFRQLKPVEENLYIIAYIVLLLREPCRLLTVRKDGELHVPSFEYDQEHPYSPDQCCVDLCKSLNIYQDPLPLSIVAELLTSCDDGTSFYHNPGGTVHILLLEASSHTALSRAIPDLAERTDVQVFCNLFSSDQYANVYYFATYIILYFLKACAKRKPAYILSGHQCDHEWITQGSSYLKAVIHSLGLEPTSEVMREACSSIAHVFKVDTSDGWYYVKSCLPGLPELAMTKCIVELFPEDTLEVVSTNYTLNCFVSKGFARAVQMTDELTEKRQVSLL